MAEWLKAHDSKSCGQQCLGGSNPLASATIKNNRQVVFFVRREDESKGSSNTPSLATTAYGLYPLASATIKSNRKVVFFVFMLLL